jgi:nitrite reductase/ring-hydroxylating ferredoxin subunit
LRDRPATRVRAGSAETLAKEGQLTTKVGSLPVVVFAHDGRAFAIEDRCPHMGFPLHQGTVEAGLVTCHWHHARFDLESGCTLDLWADDAKGFDVDIEGDDVFVVTRPEGDEVARWQRRLRDGLEESLSLVIAKSVLALLDLGVPAAEIVRTGLDFGTTYRAAGWSAGLTVLVAMANVLDALAPPEQAAALIHALVFVARDTAMQPPRFPVSALATVDVPGDRLSQWYRRFVDTRSSDAAERVLATALNGEPDLHEAETMMVAAVTDHVFVDEGHTLDFTNKAFEALALVGDSAAASVLPTLVAQTASSSRSEESGEWRHPHDLAALVQRANGQLDDALATGRPHRGEFEDVSGFAWLLFADDPEAVIDALLDAIRAGATEEQVGRGVAYAAALRIARFHVQNDFGDWNTVHHSFTSANALHHALTRSPSPELLRGAVHAVLRVYLDRFLNVPAARLPATDHGDLADFGRLWEVQGEVDTAGAIVYGYLRGGGDRDALVQTLGAALLAEDAGFHWYQVFEAAVRQSAAWPAHSEEPALILAGFARFLAAHTPTRRELPTVVRIATRLRRGERLFEEEEEE